MICILTFTILELLVQCLLRAISVLGKWVGDAQQKDWRNGTISGYGSELWNRKAVETGAPRGWRGRRLGRPRDRYEEGKIIIIVRKRKHLSTLGMSGLPGRRYHSRNSSASGSKLPARRTPSQSTLPVPSDDKSQLDSTPQDSISSSDIKQLNISSGPPLHQNKITNTGENSGRTGL